MAVGPIMLECVVFVCLSGSFTPCRHLRPSSGREHTILLLIQSGDDYLMNETRRTPTTGRQSPSLFDKWHGIFSMPSRIDTAVHTKGCDYPVAEHWGKPKCSNIGSQSNALPTEPSRLPPEDHMTPGPQQGGTSPNWGDSWSKTAPPREGHPHGAYNKASGVHVRETHTHNRSIKYLNIYTYTCVIHEPIKYLKTCTTHPHRILYI